MKGTGFTKLSIAQHERKHLCIGLDPGIPYLERLMGHPVPLIGGEGLMFTWGLSVFRATKDYAAAYKANLAFWAWCPETLKLLFGIIRSECPGIVLILDGKMGDIEQNGTYWSLFSELMGADAVTINPYVGIDDAVRPFVNRAIDCFVLARTSNPGSKELQDVVFSENGALTSVYARTVGKAVRHQASLGIALGLPDPDSFWQLYSKVPGFEAMPLLISDVTTPARNLKEVIGVLQGHKEHWIMSVGRPIVEAYDAPSPEEEDEWRAVMTESARIYHEAMCTV